MREKLCDTNKRKKRKKKGERERDRTTQSTRTNKSIIEQIFLEFCFIGICFVVFFFASSSSRLLSYKFHATTIILFIWLQLYCVRHTQPINYKSNNRNGNSWMNDKFSRRPQIHKTTYARRTHVNDTRKESNENQLKRVCSWCNWCIWTGCSDNFELNGCTSFFFFSCLQQFIYLFSFVFVFCSRSA